MAYNRSTKRKKKYALGQGEFTASARSYGGRSVSNRALRELSNPNTVFVLGKDVTYIHSSDVYWKAGLQTAETVFMRCLSKLYNEQQRKMNHIINYIDKEWKRILDAYKINTFEEFQKKYTEVYHTYGSKQKPYWDALESLHDAKILKTFLDTVSSQGAQSYEQTIKNYKKLGFDITGITTKKTSGKYSEKALVKKLQTALNNALKQLYNSKEMLNYEDYQIKALAKEMGSSISTKTSQIHAVFGKLQELIEAEVFKVLDKDVDMVLDAIQKSNTDADFKKAIKTTLQNLENNSLRVVPVIGEVEGRQSQYTKLNTGRNKSDSFDILTINGHTEAFFSTMKTGHIYDYAQKYVEGQPPPMQNRFTATLQMENLNFSHINEVSGNPSVVHSNQAQQVDALMKYVYRNAAVVGTTNKDLENFRDMTVAYYGWLKILTEIVGNPENEFMIPISLKIFDRIYSTADVIRKFQGIDMMKLLDTGFFYKTELKSKFYSWSYAASVSEAEPNKKSRKNTFNVDSTGRSLYNAKVQAIIGENGLIEEGEDVNYENLYNRIQDFLRTIAASTLKLPEVSSRLQINIDNIKRMVKY